MHWPTAARWYQPERTWTRVNRSRKTTNLITKTMMERSNSGQEKIIKNNNNLDAIEAFGVSGISDSSLTSAMLYYLLLLL